MNETLKIIEKRYSCRDFSDRAPSKEVLEAIAKAAVQSPSAMNSQNWQVIVLTDKALISELENESMNFIKGLEDQSAYQRIMSRGGQLFYNAPCVVLFAVKPENPAGYELVDLGIIAQNTVIAAESLGLASVHCGLAANAFMGEKKAYFSEKLKFPERSECKLAVLLGYENSEGSPHEPDMTKITYIE